MATDITIAGTSVDFGGDWEVRLPTSSIDVTPSATVTTTAEESIAPNDTLEITINGTTVFTGRTRSGGTKSTGGGTRVEAAHPAREFFEEDVSLSLTTPTAEQVLNATLTEANAGGQFTLSYLGSNPTLNDDYNVTDRSVKRVWKDMMDRADNLWWVNPGGTTISVNGRGAGGLWQAIDTQADRAAIRQFDSGNIDTVRNVVTVVGTGGTGLNIDADGLIIEQQTIQQDSATLQFGGGRGTSIENRNRTTKSRTDNAPPGAIIDNDRLDTDSVDSDQLVDAAVIEQKLADLAVSTTKLQNNAVINGKLDDLSVSETKIQDDSIATPKLQAEAVTAAKILADTITASEIAAGTITAAEILADTITAGEIASDTITAVEIATDTLTANEIDTLDLDTADLTISDDPSNPTTGFQFVVDSGTGRATYEPLIGTGTSSQIGRPVNRMGGVFAQTTNTDNLATSLITPQATVLNSLSVTDNQTFDWAILEPESDNTAQLGSGDGTNPTQAFAEVHTHNLFEYSPQPLSPDDDRADGVADLGTLDMAELMTSTWDDPPGYVSQRSTGDGFEPLGQSGEEAGVELGHMLNYVFEVCKAQQERIDDLEQRLTRLEKQV